MKRPLPLSSVLSEYLRVSGLEAAIDRIRVLEEWSGVVGDRIARVTRASEVWGDTLVVEVESSAWLSELTMMRSEILERMNRLTEGPSFGRILFRLAGHVRGPRTDDEGTT